MYQKLLDTYDDIEIYMEEYSVVVFHRNLVRLCGLSLTLLFYHIGVIIFTFLLSPKFEVNPVHGLIPALFFIYYFISKFAVEHYTENGRIPQFICYTFYLLMLIGSTIFDNVIIGYKCPVTFVIFFFVMTAFYTDRLFNICRFYVICGLIYPIITCIFFPGNYHFNDTIIIFSTVFFAIITYVMGAKVQADVGTDSRNYKKKSMVDMLTGLFNKVAFESEAKKFLEKRMDGDFCSLIILDFDNFKHVNDNYGHQIGDEVLKSFAGILYDSFRAKDIIGRVGGDEFMVMVTGEAPVESLDKRCENIQHKLNTLKINGAGPFSCSIGLAMDNTGADFTVLYNTADGALYQAKENGKACHVIRCVEKS